MTDFTRMYLRETIDIVSRLDARAIDNVAHGLAKTRTRGGRLFILGVGGSAAHASHAVNDFRKICGLEAYAPTDNVSELTARANDEGWATTLSRWLETSRINDRDAVFVMSVGGGDAARNISPNIILALELAQETNASIFGIVGRDGGYTATVADAVVVIPPLQPDRITPHTEGLCAVVWHLLVSHPVLQQASTKWEAALSSDATQ